jgi:predicted dehydrogenase
MNKKKVLIVGGGARGATHARNLQRWSDRVEVIGVAEPREAWAAPIAELWGIAEENIFSDWQQPLARGRIADAVVIATPDHLHVAPAIAYADQGYHILLEKPLGTTAEDCRRVADAVDRNNVMLAICHVLRYAPYTQKLKEILDNGCIGRPISVQHMEPVGYWHYAHSFVRGNWANESRSSFMLLSKSCHDLDWLAYVMDSVPRRVSSFGSLAHFRRENAPPDATDCCLDCPAEPDCPFSAQRIYLSMLAAGNRSWPLDVLTTDVTEQGILKALREGPYGQCVYYCDNDVVDHQVVNIEFEGGQTGVFTMTAFTPPNQQRRTRVFGTRGEAFCNGERIEVFDFLTEKTQVHPLDPLGEHAGGDEAMMEALVRALTENDPQYLLTGAKESLATHLAVFAAEQSRHEGRMVEV